MYDYFEVIFSKVQTGMNEGMIQDCQISVQDKQSCRPVALSFQVKYKFTLFSLLLINFVRTKESYIEKDYLMKTTKKRNRI